MDEKLSCRDARQEILHMPDTGEGQMSEPLCRHLSGCEACRSHYQAMERCGRIFAAEKGRIGELAARLESGKQRLLTRIAGHQPVRSWSRRRLVWAGAAAALLLAFVGVLTFINMREVYVPRRTVAPQRITTHFVAQAEAFETVRELAAAVSRFETPTTALPYTPPETESPSLVPRLLRECVAESQDTMRAILDSKTTLTRREET